VHRMGRRVITIAVGTALVVAAAGVSFAYWTNTGAGTGAAATGTNTAVVINQTSTVAGLAPGLAAQSLAGNFDNPNAGPVYVAAVTVVVTGTDKVGCGPTDYTIAGTAVVNAEIASGAGVGAWTGLTIQFNNKASTNQDACKNAVVALAYSSS
jgi:hypothetical protein